MDWGLSCSLKVYDKKGGHPGHGNMEIRLRWLVLGVQGGAEVWGMALNVMPRSREVFGNVSGLWYRMTTLLSIVSLTFPSFPELPEAGTFPGCSRPKLQFTLTSHASLPTGR